ncbi:imidazolonepropionase [[Luteovulum] sphaeroides subsp. megalophilum]|uniref:imidazolonepropionase n=1 Tax=Cereibacter sphaeroides TaxID=1063 RepID=UPI000B651727|nr:imidazolonepropionase [Cereibacter sphaeroides]SNS16884.1 imidazolonepropionase [[Luteovulum] sphaeroides subsp. megalophilum]
MMILGNLRVATLSDGYGLIPDAAILIESGRIQWVGPEAHLPPSAAPRHDMGGRLCTPALIDCHTHAVFAGTRAAEFEMRLKGASYAEVAAAGGGIVSTVMATRAASAEELLAASLPRIDAMLAGGVGTVEIKSGYGLDIETELRMLRVARRIGELRKVRVRTSFLGAHAVPPDHCGRPDAYLAEVVLPALKVAQDEGLVDAVDGFCEGIAFSPAQIAHLFAQAHKLRLPVKLHAEQLSNLGGAALAARHDALSADHLEYLDAEGVAALAAAGTVAVLLPGAFYALRETQAPPVAALRAAGVPMAVATDLNPGTSPLGALGLAMNMACTLFRLTPEEALAGTTIHAARALGLSDTGRIAPGFRADLAIWEAEHPAELSWRIGPAPLHARLHEGEFV